MSDSQTNAEALCQALGAIDASRFHVLLLLASISISFLVLTRQRQWLQAGSEETDCALFPLQTLSSLLTVCALLFFFFLAENSEEDTPLSRANQSAAALTAAAGLIRLWVLLQSQGSATD